MPSLCQILSIKGNWAYLLLQRADCILVTGAEALNITANALAGFLQLQSARVGLLYLAHQGSDGLICFGYLISVDGEDEVRYI